MQVAMLCPYAEGRPYGGVSGVAYDTVEGIKQLHSRLEKDGVYIHILSLHGSSYRMDTRSYTEYPNIYTHYFSPVYPFSLFGDFQYMKYLRKMGSIDLLHSHNINGACCGVLMSYPTIFTLHGIPWKEKLYYPQKMLKFKSYNETLRLEKIYGYLKDFIAISPYVYDEIRSQISNDTQKLTLIENPVSDIFFNTRKMDHGNLILCPGVIASRKNQIAAVHALNRLKESDVDVHLVFTGSVGDSNYFKKLVDTIRYYGLQQKVSITGQISFERLIEYYSEASIILLPSKQETAPMAVSEGMATGTPVIASNIAGIPYMINEGKTGFIVNPDDFNQIADRIMLLLDDKDLCIDMGRTAKKVAYERWNAKLIANKLLDLYMSSV